MGTPERPSVEVSISIPGDKAERIQTEFIHWVQKFKEAKDLALSRVSQQCRQAGDAQRFVQLAKKVGNQVYDCASDQISEFQQWASEAKGGVIQAVREAGLGRRLGRRRCKRRKSKRRKCKRRG